MTLLSDIQALEVASKVLDAAMIEEQAAVRKRKQASDDVNVIKAAIDAQLTTIPTNTLVQVGSVLYVINRHFIDGKLTLVPIKPRILE